MIVTATRVDAEPIGVMLPPRFAPKITAHQYGESAERSIPPKYSVAQVIGYIKGKSAIHIARHFGEKRRNFVGQHFWARGYFVSTVGRDEEVIRRYIQRQENEDRTQDQLKFS
jgi:hypothetical protein